MDIGDSREYPYLWEVAFAVHDLAVELVDGVVVREDVAGVRCASIYDLL